MKDDLIPLATEKKRRGDADPPEDEDKDAKSQREKLYKAAQRAELWNDGDDAYATVPVDHHLEHYAIRSNPFRRWLVHQYYLRFKDAPGRQQVEDALGLLSARAIFEGERHEPVHRVAGNGNRIWIDLCDDEWRTIEITRAGWDVVRDAPPKFIRRQGMRALPEPSHDGDIAELKGFLHLSEEHFMLAVAWLLGALRPGGQYPILTINGEQGGGKSTACRMFRRLVDPHAVEIRSPPGNQRDLVAAARHNWVVSLDNLSNIPDWLSDSLCRIATGGGVGGRKLYSDDDEAVFEAKRPILLNGIPHLTERPDLADRVLAVQVYEIPADKRRDDDSLWAAFDAAHPRILGGICDVLAATLARYDSVKLARAPRMASFARWMTAAEPALGWSAGSFLEAYLDNRADAVRITVEADLVAAAVRDFASEKSWEGTASELLSAINERQPETTIKTKDWPKTAHHFSGRLRRVAPDLRKLGVEVRELGRQGKDRRIKWKIGGISVRSVRSVQGVDSQGLKPNAEVNADRDANTERSASVRQKSAETNDLNAPNAPNAVSPISDTEEADETDNYPKLPLPWEPSRQSTSADEDTAPWSDRLACQPRHGVVMPSPRPCPIFSAEQSLQRTVVDYFALCVPAPPTGPWWTAINPIPAKSRAAAGISRSMGLRAGTPDFVMCWKGRLVGIELKAGRGRVSPAQLEAHE